MSAPESSHHPSLFQLAYTWYIRVKLALSMGELEGQARASQPGDITDPSAYEPVPTTIWPDNVLATRQGSQTLQVRTTAGFMPVQAPCFVLRDRWSGDALPWIFPSLRAAWQAVERLSGMICDLLPASDEEVASYGPECVSFCPRERPY